MVLIGTPKKDRTEYWKSQARKYCEFCKCWFADNKVSISFHENGKRHKENVQKHISQLSKKSAKEFKQKEKIDDDMKKMEAAAMAAYLNDIKNNADLTSQSINDLLNQSGSSEATIVVSNSPTSKAPPAWEEVKSDDGSSYYWNTITNGNCKPPGILQMNIKQQQKQAQKEVHMEVNAHLAREKMRELAVKKEPEPVKKFVDYGPAPRASKPYGSWTPVVNQPVEQVDLQLPKNEKVLPPPPVVVQPEIIQFKEKRIESLGDEPVEFKKRKFNNPKRNMRQKLDDD
ncbi:hypothetical protein HW555_008441 [Spodoptera exigua]|uniref:Matrin-type domain-containing protein n=1 Tax=Spodoptera exigua TaxID=7107 RepID=A0A835L4F5_SPOEX|nr:hypothetical protein HW555_008441 [Spodoptera exigua]